MTDTELTDESSSPSAEEEASDTPSIDVPDGAGCTEIWEYLSERRERESE